MNVFPTVFIVEDDKEVSAMLCCLVESAGHAYKAYGSGEEFLAAYEGQPGCIILDVRMRGMSGLRTQDALIARGEKTPIIFITGYGDIPMAVTAMKKGAMDFFTKPFNNQAILEVIQQAIEYSVQMEQKKAEHRQINERIQNLTEREQEILQAIVAGKLNKVIADELKIHISTVEAHRAKIMRKMKTKSTADLVKIALLYNIATDKADDVKPADFATTTRHKRAMRLSVYY